MTFPMKPVLVARVFLALVLVIVSSLTGVLAAGGTVPAGDAWRPTDGWFTLHHDVSRSGRTESSPGAPFEYVWHVEHRDELIAPEAEPIVAEGLVFYGTFRGFLRGVEAETG